uniref:ATP synthase complex subunit 8 n=1 Tax=Kilauella sp. KispEL TaxID=1940902 RepID=A0A8K1ZFR3_9NEOP|nr:ATP synthase F0 subunit 8 [Kilauella sp. KispEL]
MPQMNPIWWIPLFFMFISIFLFTNPLIYFIKSNNISSSTFSKTKKLINWKW